MIYLITGTGVFLWISVIISAPYLKSGALPGNGLVYSVCAPLCHQIDSRCFYLWGCALPVCTRCLGIYIGFLVGSWSYPVIRGFSVLQLPRTKTLLLLSAPIVLDKLGNFLSFWETGAWLRFTIGLLWGVILPLYFITGVADLILSRFDKYTNPDKP